VKCRGRRVGTASALLAAALAAGPVMATQYVVEIQNMAFGAAPEHLKVGDSVRWVNKDILQHTATDKQGAFDLDLLPGAQGDVTLKKPGVMEVTCRYHPNMKILLTVEEPR
jgi:plastocyanin